MNIFIFTVFCTEIPVGNVDLDQIPDFAVSELGLHCLHISPKLLSPLTRGP